MKTLIILFNILISLSTYCHAQNTADKSIKSNLGEINQSDSIYFDKNLNVYHVDSCIYKFLDAVVQGNKNSFYSDPDYYYYALKFIRHETYRSLTVWPERKNKSRTLDYTGIICISGMSFLCKGNYDEDPIFKKIDALQLKVKIQKPKKYINDSIDYKFWPVLFEPPLYGTFNECVGLPIYMEIHTVEKIAGFEMEFKKKDQTY